MKALEARLTRLEQAHEFVDLKSMTADELDLHIKTLKPGLSGYLTAVVMLINRRGSAFAVVLDDLAHKVANGHWDGGKIAT